MAGRAGRLPDLEGDFSLNAANAVAAGLLLRAGLTRLAPIHDLSGAQLAGLARRLGRRCRRGLGPQLLSTELLSIEAG